MPSIRKPPVPHDPAWAAQFAQASKALSGILGEQAVAIHHIGSTAIPGILAKPVIDILIEVTRLDAVDIQAPDFVRAGFTVKGEHGIAGRRFFSRNNEEGVRSHHVHVFEHASPHVERHLAFRDYLLAHPDVAGAYSQLKAALVSDWRGVDDYIARKSAFVVATEREALEWARRRADLNGARA